MILGRNGTSLTLSGYHSLFKSTMCICAKMTANKNRRKRRRASRKSSRATKLRKTKNENTTAQTLPEKPATTVLMLLQHPKKWAFRHLEVTRMKLCDDALSSTIAGDDHIPRDALFWTRVYRHLFFWNRDQGLFLCCSK